MPCRTVATSRLPDEIGFGAERKGWSHDLTSHYSTLSSTSVERQRPAHVLSPGRAIIRALAGRGPSQVTQGPVLPHSFRHLCERFTIRVNEMPFGRCGESSRLFIIPFEYCGGCHMRLSSQLVARYRKWMPKSKQGSSDSPMRPQLPLSAIRPALLGAGLRRCRAPHIIPDFLTLRDMDGCLDQWWWAIPIDRHPIYLP